MDEEKVVVGVLDSATDMYMYRRLGESKELYEARMERIRRDLEQNATDEDRRLAAKLLENMVDFPSMQVV